MICTKSTTNKLLLLLLLARIQNYIYDTFSCGTAASTIPSPGPVYYTYCGPTLNWHRVNVSCLLGRTLSFSQKIGDVIRM